MQWFIENRPDFSSHVETQSQDGEVRRFLSLVNRDRLKSVLRYMLDEEEFLSTLRHPRPLALPQGSPLRLVVDGHRPSSGL